MTPPSYLSRPGRAPGRRPAAALPGFPAPGDLPDDTSHSYYRIDRPRMTDSPDTRPLETRLTCCATSNWRRIRTLPHNGEDTIRFPGSRPHCPSSPTCFGSILTLFRCRCFHSSNTQGCRVCCVVVGTSRSTDPRNRSWSCVFCTFLISFFFHY
jgi:hypothetical protein